jgi:predicted nuclease of restriction endonuclease-like RecB superfamily
MPQFVDVGAADALVLAEELITLVADARGRTLGELEAAIAEVAETPLGLGLAKLLLADLTLAPDDGDVAERRWRAFTAGERLRRAATDVPVDLAGYRDAVAADVGAPNVGATLYADLPEARLVIDVPTSTPDALLHRYNVALVQGLLIRTRAVTLTVHDSDVATRRELFRQLKFHRLLADVVDTEPLTLSMTGPLSIFDQAAGYGMRLANFFPHVLHLAKWTLKAELKLKEKLVGLKLDQSAGLVSHYAKHVPYIPPEFSTLVDAFNAMPHGMKVGAATNYVHLGKQSYCVPDLTISGYGPAPVHVELFHRWHAGQLPDRLLAAAASSSKDLRLGVSRTLAKRPEIAALLAGSAWFTKFGFTFSEFPTPKCLISVLSEPQARAVEVAVACAKVKKPRRPTEKTV